MENGDCDGIFCPDFNAADISFRLGRSYEIDSHARPLLYAKSAFALEAFGYEKHGGFDPALLWRKAVLLLPMVSETLVAGNAV